MSSRTQPAGLSRNPLLLNYSRNLNASVIKDGSRASTIANSINRLPKTLPDEMANRMLLRLLVEGALSGPDKSLLPD